MTNASETMALSEWVCRENITRFRERFAATRDRRQRKALR
jgi:hypothetical protein